MKVYIHYRSAAVPNRRKPKHQLRDRMIPIRVSSEESEWLEVASSRFGLPISQLMRDGARLLVKQLERKDEPNRKES